MTKRRRLVPLAATATIAAFVVAEPHAAELGRMVVVELLYEPLPPEASVLQSSPRAVRVEGLALAVKERGHSNKPNGEPIEGMTDGYLIYDYDEVTSLIDSLMKKATPSMSAADLAGGLGDRAEVVPPHWLTLGDGTEVSRLFEAPLGGWLVYRGPKSGGGALLLHVLEQRYPSLYAHEGKAWFAAEIFTPIWHPAIDPIDPEIVRTPACRGPGHVDYLRCDTLSESSAIGPKASKARAMSLKSRCKSPGIVACEYDLQSFRLEDDSWGNAYQQQWNEALAWLESVPPPKREKASKDAAAKIEAWLDANPNCDGVLEVSLNDLTGPARRIAQGQTTCWEPIQITCPAGYELGRRGSGGLVCAKDSSCPPGTSLIPSGIDAPNEGRCARCPDGTTLDFAGAARFRRDDPRVPTLCTARSAPLAPKPKNTKR